MSRLDYARKLFGKDRETTKKNTTSGISQYTSSNSTTRYGTVTSVDTTNNTATIQLDGSVTDSGTASPVTLSVDVSLKAGDRVVTIIHDHNATVLPIEANVIDKMANTYLLVDGTVLNASNILARSATYTDSELAAELYDSSGNAIYSTKSELTQTATSIRSSVTAISNNLETNYSTTTQTATAITTEIGHVKQVSNKVSTYQVSTSGTTVPTGTWQSNIPTVPAGQYLWTKTVTSYSGTDSTGAAYPDTTEYTVSYAGTNGTSGTSVTITSKSVRYATSTSGTTTPTSWQSTVPTVSQGQYLWTKTYVLYSDGNSTTSYSVAYQGQDGSSATTYIEKNSYGLNVYDSSINEVCARVGTNGFYIVPTSTSAASTAYAEFKATSITLGKNLTSGSTQGSYGSVTFGLGPNIMLKEQEDYDVDRSMSLLDLHPALYVAADGGFTVEKDMRCNGDAEVIGKLYVDGGLYIDTDCEVYGCQSIYTNSSGSSSGSITLTKSAADFAFIEVVLTDGTRKFTQRIYNNYSSETAVANRAIASGSSYMYLGCIQLTVSGKTLTISNNYQWCNAAYSGSGTLRVTNVIGWR